MKFILNYLKNYKWRVIGAMLLKFLATCTELLIPYVLEHMVDDVAPTKDLKMVISWGLLMLALAVAVRFINVTANRKGVKISSECTYEIRRDLFWHSLKLSGDQTDEFGLPSLTSRMTADSYNVQNFIRMAQTLGIRAPIMLIGGIAITLTMDTGLAMILVLLTPFVIGLVVFVSSRGIPLYVKVQESLDRIVRIMRENITGIRVVKALSKEDYEKRRYEDANREMNKDERKVGSIMALPGPLVTLFLNVGLTLVVIIGAKRVNSGLTKPGVILAFLTYFNMILMAVNALNRFFTMMSKADASACRIAAVVEKPFEPKQIPDELAAHTDSTDHIVFEDVCFSYGDEDTSEKELNFNGEERHKALDHISFSVKKGGSLGIIGATGCGKTTVINLLMRFYDPDSGSIFINGKDIRTYDIDDLHRMFGVVFQNDVIFADSIANNIAFGRKGNMEEMKAAATDAASAEFIGNYPDTFEHRADIRGANFSGGQKQRLLITRALYSRPQILVLDDSSSALDYKTDSSVRKAIREHYSGTTTVIIAQRISSLMNLDEIIMLKEGHILCKGPHEQLMRTCPEYVKIYETQMGEGA